MDLKKSNNTSQHSEDTGSIDSIDLTVATQDWINNMSLDTPASIGAIDSITMSSGGLPTRVYTITGSTNTAIIGANGYSYGDLNTQAGIIAAGGTIDLKGENADIRVNGVSLMDTLNSIAERLNILRPNPELETEWDQLKALGNQYRVLEKEFKEKSEMWETLKAMPPPNID